MERGLSLWRGGGGVRESQVQDRGSRGGVKWELGVNPGGVEKVVRDVKGGIEVACRDDKLPFGKGAAGICKRMVEVKVTQDQVRVGEKGKNSLRQHGAVGRTVSAQMVHRSDPEGAVGGSQKALWRKDINRNHVRRFVKNC